MLDAIASGTPKPSSVRCVRLGLLPVNGDPLGPSFDPQRGRSSETDSALGHAPILPRRAASPLVRRRSPPRNPTRYG